MVVSIPPLRAVLQSLPSRGAWIEIACSVGSMLAAAVAPLAGSVDRNTALALTAPALAVAPLAGSVDRNISALKRTHRIRVAPLAGSVDRNTGRLSR